MSDRPKFHDPVNHPSHYTSHPSGVECIQVVEHMSFCVGNVIKYLWRSGLKEGAPNLQDLKKARWYLDREIQRLSGEVMCDDACKKNQEENGVHRPDCPNKGGE